jgi:hypothetical protein
MINANRTLVGKPEEMRPLGKPVHRWMDNIKIYLTGIGCEGIVWIHIAEDWVQWWALVNMVINLVVPYKVENFLASRASVSFASRTLLCAGSQKVYYHVHKSPPLEPICLIHSTVSTYTS